jgi:hypothetical protein
MSKTLHIVYRENGQIISASESKTPLKPAHMHGLNFGEFEVPAKFGDKKRMHEFLPHLVVDVAARRLKEK